MPDKPNVDIRELLLRVLLKLEVVEPVNDHTDSDLSLIVESFLDTPKGEEDLKARVLRCEDIRIELESRCVGLALAVRTSTSRDIFWFKELAPPLAMVTATLMADQQLEIYEDNAQYPVVYSSEPPKETVEAITPDVDLTWLTVEQLMQEMVNLFPHTALVLLEQEPGTTGYFFRFLWKGELNTVQGMVSRLLKRLKKTARLVFSDPTDTTAVDNVVAVCANSEEELFLTTTVGITANTPGILEIAKDVSLVDLLDKANPPKDAHGN
jgi:hypothetical protein